MFLETLAVGSNYMLRIGMTKAPHAGVFLRRQRRFLETTLHLQILEPAAKLIEGQRQAKR